MTRRVQALCALFAALVLCAVSAPLGHAHEPQAEGERDLSAEARAHFERGVEIYRRGDLRGTLAEFERANALRESPLLDFYIGKVAFELSEFARSYRAFERFLLSPKDEATATQRVQASERLGELHARVAFANIITNVDGARVTIDDEDHGVSPLKAPVVLDVGTHRIRATKSGHAAIARVVTLAGGDHVTVELALEPFEQPPQAAPEAHAHGAPAPSEQKLMTPLLWTGVAATVAFATAGTVTGAMALKASHGLNDTRFTGTSGQRDFENERDRVHALSLSSDLLLGAAGLTAGVTLGFVVWRARQNTHAPADRPSFQARLSAHGLMVQGAF